MSRYAFLAALHGLLRPTGYLEIGVQGGGSLALAQCPSVGVDPAPLVAAFGQQTLYTMTSDEFFAHPRDLPPLDLVFIDGMHLFEYALRDFMAVERLAHRGGVVVFDDVLPYNEAIAARTQPAGDWTGDVWKIHDILTTVRPGLELLLVDTFPTGALVVRGLDPASEILAEAYEHIVATYTPHETVPDEYLDRTNTITQDAALARLAAPI